MNATANSHKKPIDSVQPIATSPEGETVRKSDDLSVALEVRLSPLFVRGK